MSSRRGQSQRDQKKVTRRTIDASSKRSNKGGISQKEIDSAAHRLSRLPDKFNANRAVQAEKQEPYCVSFFRNNPEAVDLRPPAEKLQELEEKAEIDLEPSSKFTTLMQIKSIQYMLIIPDFPEKCKQNRKNSARRESGQSFFLYLPTLSGFSKAVSSEREASTDALKYSSGSTCSPLTVISMCR